MDSGRLSQVWAPRAGVVPKLVTARASLDGGRNRQYEEIARGIRREEYEQALALARELDLRLDARSVRERRQLARAV